MSLGHKIKKPFKKAKKAVKKVVNAAVRPFKPKYALDPIRMTKRTAESLQDYYNPSPVVEDTPVSSAPEVDTIDPNADTSYIGEQTSSKKKRKAVGKGSLKIQSRTVNRV